MPFASIRPTRRPRAPGAAERVPVWVRPSPGSPAAGALLLLLCLGSAPLARSAEAQYPGGLAGTVRDAITGEPVEDVLVEVVGAGLMALSDGRGAFRLNGLEPGLRLVRLSRLGYEPQVREVEIRNGQTAWLTVALGASPLRLKEIHAGQAVGGEASTAGPGVYSISRGEIEASGAVSAGDLLDGRAGLVIHQRGPLGPQNLSIRGSEANQVLVLLDGVPLADPLTGLADLSAVPASRIDSITIVKGASSARYGSGAAAGAVLIASKADAPPLALGASSGSLGAWSAGAETGGDFRGLSWSAGGRLRSADGEFQFERPALVGGGTATRTNNELAETNLFASLSSILAGGHLGLRGGFERLDRGIPGPSYAPTPTAAEQLRRWSGQISWEHRGGHSVSAAALYGLDQQTSFSDPDPP
ncbi:MAG: TonB-dependent receptor plug domain-containing protein, partial [Gemmatimonadota bacterium]